MAQAKILKDQNYNRFTSSCSDGIFVENILLTNFRNYNSVKLDLALDEPTPVVLFGKNGAGKTNLLEALSYLSAGRGLRGARLSEVANNQGDGNWAVSAEIQGYLGAVKVGTGIMSNNIAEGEGQQKQNDRRIVRLDGNAVSGPAALSDIISMVWLTPKMDRLFLESGSGRRKFFDRFVQGLHPDHARHLGAYERTMRERIALLSENNGRRADPSWLQALEKRMAEHGVALAAARNETLAHLTAQIEKQPDGAFPKADMALDGLLENHLHDSSALEVEDNFIKALAAARESDKATGRTSIGPHKADLLVSHQIKNMPARLCSTGEQKALLIGIVLANVRLQRALSGQAPILLLDEISAHLDEKRRVHLFDELVELNCQAWLTGTDESLFSALAGKAKFLSVSSGNIHM